jgi:hypothetical protein
MADIHQLRSSRRRLQTRSSWTEQLEAPGITALVLSHGTCRGTHGWLPNPGSARKTSRVDVTKGRTCASRLADGKRRPEPYCVTPGSGPLQNRMSAAYVR